MNSLDSEGKIKISINYIGASQKQLSYCPRCGLKVGDGVCLLALSRRANIMICDQCGMLEALEDAGLKERLPLSKWRIVK